ncbi:MAG: hypothetical protein R3C10_24405 [Pirellulales bacterium]|nr:hypothetical protein [Planctomycetales bacterium]
MKPFQLAGILVGIASLLSAVSVAWGDNPLGLSDASQSASTASESKSSWLPFNLFQPSKTPAASHESEPSGPSMMDRVSASFAKMNADTKRAFSRTATTLGFKNKPKPAQTPFGHLGGTTAKKSTKDKSTSSGFSSLFVRPAPRPSSTLDDFFNQPRPGEEAGR